MNPTKVLDTKTLFYFVLDFLHKSKIVAKKVHIININSKEGNIPFLTKDINIIVCMNAIKTNFLEF